VTDSQRCPGNGTPDAQAQIHPALGIVREIIR
jgi:hypothetical protein